HVEEIEELKKQHNWEISRRELEGTEDQAEDGDTNDSSSFSPPPSDLSQARLEREVAELKRRQEEEAKAARQELRGLVRSRLDSLRQRQELQRNREKLRIENFKDSLLLEICACIQATRIASEQAAQLYVQKR
ncbi:hypothetical protein CSUI_006627, partial [Cystoisospora suis]